MKLILTEGDEIALPNTPLRVLMTRPMTLKFQTFSLFLLATYCGNLSVIGCAHHFLLQILRRWLVKLNFLKFMVFHWAAKMRKCIPIINRKTKLFV